MARIYSDARGAALDFSQAWDLVRAGSAEGQEVSLG